MHRILHPHIFHNTISNNLRKGFYVFKTLAFQKRSGNLLLYLLSPFINYFLNNAPKQLVEYCIFLLGIIYIVVPTLTNYTLAGESTITLFISVYLIGGYVRLYGDTIPFFHNRRKNVLCALICWLFIVFSVILNHFIHLYPNDYFMRAQSLPLVLLSFSLFLAIKNTQFPYTPVINQVAGSVLGIYLIHDNPYVRDILWAKILHNAVYGNSPFLIIHMITSVVIVFLVCMVIEKIRIYLFEKPFMHYLAPHLEQLQINLMMK